MDTKKIIMVLAVMCGIMAIIIALTVQQSCSRTSAEKEILKQLVAISDHQKANEKITNDKIDALQTDMGSLKKQQDANAAKTDEIFIKMGKIKVPTLDEFAKKVVDASNCLQSYNDLLGAFSLCKTKEEECDKLQFTVAGERTTFAQITTNYGQQTTLLTQNYKSADERATKWEKDYKALYSRKNKLKFWDIARYVVEGFIVGYVIKTVTK